MARTGPGVPALWREITQHKPDLLGIFSGTRQADAEFPDAGASPGRTSGRPCCVLLGPRCQEFQHPVTVCSTPHAASTARLGRSRRMLTSRRPASSWMLRYELWLVHFEPKRSGTTWARSKAQEGAGSFERSQISDHPPSLVRLDYPVAGKRAPCVVVGYFASPPSASSARLKRLFQSGWRMV